MLDTLTHSPDRARYPTPSDAAIGLRPADLARTPAPANGQATAPRTANDWAKRFANRGSIARFGDQAPAPPCLSGDGRYDAVGPLSKLTRVAREELARFYNIVYRAGYELRLHGDKEFVIDRCSDSRSENSDSPRPIEKQKYERTERLQPLGAHALDRRAVQTHCGSRDRAGTSAANCEVSVFDPAGNSIGFLELLAIDPKQPVPLDGMTRALLQAAARAIEERLFRDQYRREWIVMANPEDVPGSGMLFAVDRYQNVVAVDRYARSVLSGNSALETMAHGRRISFWTLFEKDSALFRSNGCRDIPAQLTPAGTAETWLAVITPPDSDLSVLPTVPPTEPA